MFSNSIPNSVDLSTFNTNYYLQNIANIAEAITVLTWKFIDSAPDTMERSFIMFLKNSADFFAFLGSVEFVMSTAYSPKRSL